MTVAYTEFFVSHASGASDLNGGGPRVGVNDGPIYTTTVNTSVGDIVDQAVSNWWAGCAVDDFLIWDTTGAKSLHRITGLNLGICSVTPVIAGADEGKTVNVGGAWPCIQVAATKVKTTTINAAGNSPRINLPTGTTFNEAVLFNTNAGTPALPIIVEGYTANPGDIDSEVSTVRVPIRPVVITITNGTPAANPCVVTVAAGHNFGAGQVVKIAAAAGGTWASLNGDRTITSVGTTTLTFGAVNASGYGTNTTGGTASPFDGATAKSTVINGGVAETRFLNLDISSTLSGKSGMNLSGSMVVAYNCAVSVVAANAIELSTAAACAIRCLVTGGMTGIRGASATTVDRNIIVGTTVAGVSGTFATNMKISENVIYGNSGCGISMGDTSTNQHIIEKNIIADNALDGITLINSTLISKNRLRNNIIAHNGTSNAGGSLTKATPGILTITGQATQYINGTAVQFTGSTITAITDGLTYFLKRSAGASPNWTYTICLTAAIAANIDCNAGTANADNLTSKIGFGIASSVTAGPYHLGVNAYNNLYGNICGPIQTFAGNADGTVSLLDNGLHNDTANAPFTGGNAAARLANGYTLNTTIGIVKSFRQYLPAAIGTVDSTYPDAGAIQVIDGAAAQLVADTAAVTAGVTDIKNTRTILNVTGTLNMSLWTLSTTINWPTISQVLYTGTPYWGITGALSDGNITLPADGQKVLTSQAAFGVGGTSITPSATIPTGSDVQSDASAYGINGTSETPSYPTTEVSKAAQLSDDRSEVDAVKASILTSVTDLLGTIDGELVMGGLIVHSGMNGGLNG
jgi:hypothetical protein